MSLRIIAFSLLTILIEFFSTLLFYRCILLFLFSTANIPNSHLIIPISSCCCSHRLMFVLFVSNYFNWLHFPIRRVVCVWMCLCPGKTKRKKNEKFNLPLCGPAQAITSAVPNNVPNTIAVTHRARFCEHTATPSRVGRPLVLSPPVFENIQKKIYKH